MLLGFLGWDNTPGLCDDATSRLDHLFNISPDSPSFDDNLFSRSNPATIGSGNAAYGDKGSTWIK